MSSPENFARDTEHRNLLQVEFIRQVIGGDAELERMGYEKQRDLFRLISSIIDENETIRELAEAEDYDGAIDLMKRDFEDKKQLLAA